MIFLPSLIRLSVGLILPKLPKTRRKASTDRTNVIRLHVTKYMQLPVQTSGTYLCPFKAAWCKAV